MYISFITFVPWTPLFIIGEAASCFIGYEISEAPACAAAELADGREDGEGHPRRCAWIHASPSSGRRPRWRRWPWCGRTRRARRRCLTTAESVVLPLASLRSSQVPPATPAANVVASESAWQVQTRSRPKQLMVPRFHSQQATHIKHKSHFVNNLANKESDTRRIMVTCSIIRKSTLSNSYLIKINLTTFRQLIANRKPLLPL